MKTIINLSISLLFISLMTAQERKENPLETEQVVQKMIDAHGGYDAWKKVKTFSFDNIMYSNSLGKLPFWINQVTVDSKTRNVYQNWPIHGSTMAYDGKQAWGNQWKVGNPPKFEALFFYYFLNLPWLTQDDNVVLGKATKKKHKAFQNEVYVIDMSFSEKPAVGKTKEDTYKLYIDSKNFLLMGYEYTISYGYMLDLFKFPKGQNVFGPMFRVHNGFTKVGDLIYPTVLRTSNLDQTQVFGDHAIFNYGITKPFDKSKLIKPKGAQIDPTSHIRADK